MNTHNHTTITPAVAAPMERRSPSRAPSVHSDASVPLRQAVISGALVGVSLTMIVALLILGIVGRLSIQNLQFLAGLCIAITILLSTILWFVQLSAAQRSIWAIDKLAHLDGDEHQGEPEKSLRWVSINSSGSPRQINPTDQVAQRFEEFITLAYKCQKTDIRTARQHGFSDKEWTVFMAALESAQLVQRTRSGENAPRRLLAPSAHACIMTMRQRGMFVCGVS